MPGGDDDDDVDDVSEDISDSEIEGNGQRFLDISQANTKNNTMNRSGDNQSRQNFIKPVDNSKFLALYDDAKHRNLRQEHIYAKCFDKECTFKPTLVTKKSKISQMTVKEVQKEVYEKSQKTD